LGRRCRLRAAPHAERRDHDEARDDQAVAEVPQPVARQEAQREQGPECSRTQPMGVAAIPAREPGARREEHAADRVDVREPDQLEPPDRSSMRRRVLSSRARRRPWMASAASAVGMAQRERSNGWTTMPLCSMKPLMSRIEAMAMKMSSPK